MSLHSSVPERSVIVCVRAFTKGFVLLAMSVSCCLGSIPEAMAQTPSVDKERQVYNLYLEYEKALRSGDRAKAIGYLRRAARFDPSSYSAHVHAQLADSFLRSGDYKNSVGEAETALKFDSACDEAYYSMALCYWKSRDYDNCVSSLEKYISMGGEKSTKSSARKLLKEVAAYSAMNKASAHLNKGHYGKAVFELERAAKYDPSPYSAAVHKSLAFALARTGRPERAIKEGIRAVDLDPGDKDTIYNTAIAYQDVAKFDQAVDWLNRYMSMEADPARRKAAATLLIELREDSKQYRNADNNLPDYLVQMKSEGKLARWSRDAFPLKVFLHSGRGVKGYRSEFDNYVLESLDTWCRESGKKISYSLVDSPEKANLSIKWQGTELKGKVRIDHRLKAGLTNLRWNSQKEIENAEVCVLTVDAFAPDKPVEEGVCASVCMHEIGHALGLGHSTYIYDVMYFRSSSKQTGRPTKRDRATIARLYSSYPVISDFKSRAKPLPGGKKIRYLPPPTFLPPAKPRTDKIVPPVFLPPPKKRKIHAPVFTPPAKTARPKKPTFLPPPVKKVPEKRNMEGSSSRPKSRPPVFVPPPPK